MNKAELEKTVLAARDGDKASVEKLYTEYREKIWFFVSKNVYSSNAIEDIVSDTFLTAIEKLSELKCCKAFDSWLYSIAYNKCLQQHNFESNIARFESDEELESTMENSSLNEPVRVPSDYLENEETKEQLKQAIDGLKSDMRSAVILYYFEELSIADVGKALGLNENATKQKLFQARKKLTSKLKKLCKSGSVFCLVPLGAVLNTYDVKSAVAIKSGTAVFSSGFAAKLIGGCTAAALAVGIPAALKAVDSRNDLPTVDNKEIGDIRPEKLNNKTYSTDDNDIAEFVQKDVDDLKAQASAALHELKDKRFEYSIDYQPVNSEEHIVSTGEADDIDLSEYFLGYIDSWNVSSGDDQCETARCCETLYFPAADAEVKLYCLSENNSSVYRLYIPTENSTQICVELKADKSDEYIEDKVLRASERIIIDNMPAEEMS